jgi:hypothetical protein
MRRAKSGKRGSVRRLFKRGSNRRIGAERDLHTPFRVRRSFHPSRPTLRGQSPTGDDLWWRRGGTHRQKSEFPRISGLQQSLRRVERSALSKGELSRILGRHDHPLGRVEMGGGIAPRDFAEVPAR